MKVLFVSPHFPPRYIGGVEIYTKRLADTLLSLGEKPEILCVERIDSEQPGVRIVRDTAYGYAVHRLHASLVGRHNSLAASYSNPDVQHAVEQLLETVTPDVLHLHSGYLLGGEVMAAAHRRSIPTVVTLHDFWFICPRITLVHPSGAICTGPDSAAKCAWCLATERRRYRLPDTLSGGRLGRRMIKLLEHRSLASLAGRSDDIRSVSARHEALFRGLARADVILSPSRFLRDQMVRAGFPGERILVSRYGIETRPVNRRDRGPAEPLRVGYLGQIAPHKGVHLLIEAVQQLPSAPLAVRVYGDPAPHPRYAQRLTRFARADARIALLGPYRHSAVNEILAELDAVVVPSMWYENSPFVVQEAQAARVPVIASDLGGMRELVTDQQNGLLFEAGNARDLARQLQRVLDEPSLLERLRSDVASVRPVEHEIRELRDWYQRLLRPNVTERPALPGPNSENRR
jgi:glycosyltransferase involved in cell wall biosynthesis